MVSDNWTRPSDKASILFQLLVRFNRCHLNEKLIGHHVHPEHSVSRWREMKAGSSSETLTWQNAFLISVGGTKLAMSFQKDGKKPNNMSIISQWLAGCLSSTVRLTYGWNMLEFESQNIWKSSEQRVQRGKTIDTQQATFSTFLCLPPDESFFIWATFKSLSTFHEILVG